jgi:hypothetical protein
MLVCLPLHTVLLVCVAGRVFAIVSLAGHSGVHALAVYHCRSVLRLLQDPVVAAVQVVFVTACLGC